MWSFHFDCSFPCKRSYNITESVNSTWLISGGLCRGTTFTAFECNFSAVSETETELSLEQGRDPWNLLAGILACHDSVIWHKISTAWVTLDLWELYKTGTEQGHSRHKGERNRQRGNRKSLLHVYKCRISGINIIWSQHTCSFLISTKHFKGPVSDI